MARLQVFRFSQLQLYTVDKIAKNPENVVLNAGMPLKAARSAAIDFT